MKEATRRKLKLTDKQLAARKAVDDFINEFHYPPTYREIADILKVKSSNTAYVILRGYRDKMVKMSNLKK